MTDVIKIEYIYKPLQMKREDVKRRRNYLEQTGYVFVGFGVSDDDIEDAKFEKRIHVGKEVAGMLELVDQLERVGAYRGQHDGAVRCCPGCKSEWGHINGNDIKENHADDCEIKAFKEAFTDGD